ncbi:hypothetical protein GPALN_007489 [Globodera pallida]|nr:hypothetical protein GPALN_007489 [Globodera pallida]
MLLSIFFSLASDYAHYNPNKMFAELREMTNSLSDDGGKAAEERALAKGCHQIIQKLYNNPKYKTVLEEHSKLAQFLNKVLMKFAINRTTIQSRS